MRCSHDWTRQPRGDRCSTWLPADVMERWLGERLCWGQSLDAGTGRVGIVSSRIGSIPGRQAVWLMALRQACEQVDPVSETVLSSPETTTARWLDRACRLLDRRLLKLVLPGKREATITAWLDGLSRRNLSLSDQPACWYLSPPAPANCSAPASRPTGRQPIRDAAVVAAADRLIVLGLRRGGNLLPLLMARLDDPAWAADSLVLAIGPGLVPYDLARPLFDRGATGWEPVLPVSQDAATVSPESSVCLVELPRQPGQWLTHCTRRFHGPWPDQAENEYLDQWLLNPFGTDYSAAAALARIVTQRRLRASAQGIRGGSAVVSFTAVTPAELTKLRTYRRHRRRWDFEPYGLAIRRDWLVERGARPVVYGDARRWPQLSEQDRPFFQRNSTSGGASGGQHAAAMDWTVEQEWRHVGDVDLTDLPAAQARLLVPHPAAARRLVSLSPWPIALLPEP